MAMRNDSAGFPVSGALKREKVRVEIDSSAGKLGYKIRQARMEKVPYIVIVGEKETNHKSISVRRRDAKEAAQDLGEMSISEAVNEDKRFLSASKFLYLPY